MSEEPKVDFAGKLVPGREKQFMKESGSQSRELWQVDVGLIRVMEDFNVRIRDGSYEEHIARLSASMLEDGFFQDKPLSCYVAKEGDGSRLYVTDGHCRLEAAKRAIAAGAQFTRVPVVVHQVGASIEDLTVALVRSNDGKALSPLEIGIVCSRLVKYGMDSKDVSKRLCFSQPYVDGLLLLVGGSAEIRNLVQSGRVSATTAIKVLRDFGVKAEQMLLEGLKRANAAGKEKVTAKHIAAAQAAPADKVAKKYAPKMLEAIQDLASDPGFDGVSESVRKKLLQILEEVLATHKPPAHNGGVGEALGGRV